MRKSFPAISRKPFGSHERTESVLPAQCERFKKLWVAFPSNLLLLSYAVAGRAKTPRSPPTHRVYRMKTYAATRQELSFERAYTTLCTTFESLLGRTAPDAVVSAADLSPDQVRAKFESYVGPLDFSLFQKLDHDGVLRALGLGSVTP